MNEHVVGECLDIEEPGVGRIAGHPVALEALGAVIVVHAVVTRKACHGHRVKLPIGGIGPVDGVAMFFLADDVVVFVFATMVLSHERLFKILLGLVHPPIHAIQIEMVFVAPGRRLTLGNLEIPGENIPGKNRVSVEVVPARSLRTAEVNAIGRIRSVGSEDRVVQLRGAIFATETETKAVFWNSGITTGAATDPQARVFLEAFGAIGVEELHRGHPFPGVSLATRVDVDAGAGMKKIVELGHQRNGWDREQGVVDLVGVVRILGDVRIHAILDDLTIDIRRRPVGSGRGVAGRALVHHVGDKDVGVGVDIGRVEAGLVSPRTDTSRLIDRDRPGVERAARVGIAAVQGIVNLRARRVAGDHQIESRGVEPAVVIETGVGNEVCRSARVDCART